MGEYEPYSPSRRGPVFGHNVCPHDLCERENHDSLAKVKLNVQSFTGKEDPVAYIEWEERCDQTFHVHGFSEAKRVDLVIMEFSGYHLLGGISCKKIGLHRVMNMFTAGL
jgi:hypothetical protein